MGFCCSLNNARKMILQLAEPMVKVLMNIHSNMEYFKEERKRIFSSTETREELERNLNIEIDDLEMRPLPQPVTVCTSKKCVEIIEVQGKQKFIYKTRCHEDCDTNLKNCLVMNNSGCCTICGCHWQKHMHQTIEYIKVKRVIVDLNKEKEIEATDNSIKQRSEKKKMIRQTLTEYQQEFKVIQDVCAKLAYILANSAGTSYSRFVEPYLHLLIDEEKQKVVFVPNYPSSTYDLLIEMKENHHKKIIKLTEDIAANAHEELTIEHIDQLSNELLQLTHSGPQFRNMIRMVGTNKQKELKQVERPALELNVTIDKVFNFVKAPVIAIMSGVKKGYKMFFG